ncbi:MAG: hypothetical protein KGR26_15190, partial [Cyanobacteria bacterium REEB65]|nr:hypothetical protein [Cyanobacteria bacterium REEB65]
SAQATADWSRALAMAPQGPTAERVLYLLATKGTRDRQAAAVRYLQTFPKGLYAVAVARSLDPETMTLPDREAIGELLLESGEYGPAVRILANDPDPLALYYLGRADWRLGQSVQAMAALAHAQQRDPTLLPRIELTRGQMAMAKSRWSEALSHLDVAARASGQIGLLALHEVLRVDLKTEDDRAAQAVDREVRRRYPDSDDAAAACWRALWRAHDAGQLHKAAGLAEGLAKRDDGFGIAGQYWLARMTQDSGKIPEALALYGKVIQRVRRLPSAGYYGWRARMRRDALEGRAQDPGFAIEDGPARPRSPGLDGLLPLPDRRALGLAPRSGLPGAQNWPADVRVFAYLDLIPPSALPPGQGRILVAAGADDFADAIRWAESAEREGDLPDPYA